MAEAMRRAFADRARYLGDPDFNNDMPIDAADLEGLRRGRCARRSTRARRRSRRRRSFAWPTESDETTHLSVVDADAQRGRR